MDYQFSLRILIAALCGGVSAFLAIKQKNGWGWFLFVAILLVP